MLIRIGGGLSRATSGNPNLIKARPGVGAASWTGPAPGVSGVTRYAQPGVGQASWSGIAPAIVLPVVAAPGVGAASWTGPAPSVTGLLQNLWTFPSDFSNAVWTGDEVTKTASSMTQTTTNDTHGIRRNSAIDSGALYASEIEFQVGANVQYVQVSGYVGVGWSYCNFDIVNGTQQSSGGPSFASAAITSMGSGWYLCRVNFSASDGTLAFMSYCMVTSGSAGNRQAFAGNVSDYVNIRNAALYKL